MGNKVGDELDVGDSACSWWWGQLHWCCILKSK